MGKRQRDWARRLRVQIRKDLGNKCAHCGATEELEFDCISPKGDEHHKMEQSARVSFYRVQYALGNLQLLCEKCHKKKTSFEQTQYFQEPETDDNQPF